MAFKKLLLRDRTMNPWLLILATMISFATIANAASVHVSKQFLVKQDSKFILFTNNRIRAAKIDDLKSIRSGYCLLENYKLKTINLQPGTRWEFMGEKIRFPNDQIVRFAVLETADFSLYCDGTFAGRVESARSLLKQHAGKIFKNID